MALLSLAETGRRIRRRRAALGLTQKGLARVLRVLPSQLCYWERGERPVPWRYQAGLARALRVPVAWILVDDLDDTVDPDADDRPAPGVDQRAAG